MKLQMTPVFPANVVSGNGVAVVVVNGTTYTISAALATRIITVAGNVVVAATDQVVAINKAIGQATSVALPTAASRNGSPLTIKDLKGDADANMITLVTAGIEVIDGYAAQDIINTIYGARTLVPIAGGWLRI